MTLRRKDLQDAERAEPRALPHKESGPGAVSDRPHTGPETAPDRPRKTDFNLRLDPDDHRALQLESERTGISIAGIIRSLVREHLRKTR